jgi:large subunit ribosomal protein L33
LSVLILLRAIFFAIPDGLENPTGEVPMAKKSGRIIVTLECTEARGEGKPVSRYTTSKNKTKTPGRLEMKKYNPNLKRHTLHRETK